MHENCKKESGVYKTFAQQGDLDGFRRALALNVPLCEGCYSAAAREGQMDILKFMHNNHIKSWDDDACIAATEGGHLQALTFAHKQGRIKLTTEIATIAAKEGYADVLEYYIIQKGPRPSAFIIQYAVERGHLSCLDLIVRNSYVIGPQPPTGIMFQMAANTAIACNQVGCLDYVLRNCPPTEQILEHGMPILYQRCCYHGNLSALKMLHHFETHQMKRAASWTVTACSTAASKDDFDCLYYARESGCPWDENTCAFASMSNSVRCLMYALKQGCPFDSRMLLNAVVRENMDCVHLALVGFDVKVSESALKIAVRSANDNVEMLSLLINHFRNQKENEFNRELFDKMIHTASYVKNLACLEYLLNRFGLPKEDAVYGSVCANAA